MVLTGKIHRSRWHSVAWSQKALRRTEPLAEPEKMGTVFRGKLASMLMAHVLGCKEEGLLMGRPEANLEILSEGGGGSLGASVNSGR